MPTTSRPVVPTIAVLLAVAGCGEQNSYGAAEGALRDWLSAAHEGDELACELVTPQYREELEREARTHPGGSTCEEQVAELAKSGERSLPPADSSMAVLVWDPSGEALVEVTDAASDRVAKFWMQYENNTWLVAGLR